MKPNCKPIDFPGLNTCLSMWLKLHKVALIASPFNDFFSGRVKCTSKWLNRFRTLNDSYQGLTFSGIWLWESKNPPFKLPSNEICRRIESIVGIAKWDRLQPHTHTSIDLVRIVLLVEGIAVDCKGQRVPILALHFRENLHAGVGGCASLCHTVHRNLAGHRPLHEGWCVAEHSGCHPWHVRIPVFWQDSPLTKVEAEQLFVRKK